MPLLSTAGGLGAAGTFAPFAAGVADLAAGGADFAAGLGITFEDGAAGFAGALATGFPLGLE